MNNLKFRVWSDYHKSFVIEGGGFGLQRLFEDFSFTLRGRFSRGEDYKMPSNVEDYEINQWTGLVDKNGIDIYQGDYLSFTIPKITHGPEAEHITNAEVWYDVETASWQFGKFVNKNCSPPHEWSYDLSWPLDKKSILVTGNIYQNQLDNLKL